MPKPKVYRSITIICLAAFTMLAIFSEKIVEHVPHSEDEVAYIFQAKVFAQNRLTVPTPSNDEAFWSPFVLDYQGLRFGKYPPGWPLLLSLGVRLNMPWIVNAILAVLTLALVAQLGAYFYKSTIGIWAAGLALVTPGFLLLSSSFLSHPASLFWSTLALLFLFHLTATSNPNSHYGLRTTHYAPRFQPIYALLTGAALGAAFITRPFAALGIGLAVEIFLLVLLIRRDLKWTLLFWLVAGGLLIALLLPLYWWAISGDPTFNPYLLVWPYDRLGFGPDIGPHGYTLQDAIFINVRLKIMTLATGLFGWPGWSNLFFLPLPFLTRQANRWDWLLLGTIVGLIVVHTFYWAFGGSDGGFPRYYYDALPAFVLLTTRGIQILVKFISGAGLSWLNFSQKWRKALAFLPVALVVGFVAYSLVWKLPPLVAAQKGKYNITARPIQAVEQANLPGPALVLVKNVEGWSDFAAPFAANSPNLDGPVVYAIDWGPRLTQRVRTQFAERTCWEVREGTLARCPAVKE